MSIGDEIRASLRKAQDLAYKKFQGGLIPTIKPEQMIGVRTPTLRRLAGQFSHHQDVEVFLKALPHYYFEENQLHAFIIGRERDYKKCLGMMEDFLPYVDNWATCDQLSPGVFKKHRDDLWRHAKMWLESEHAYTRRFGIGMLMQHYLDDEFRPEYPQWVADIHSEEYYVKMMIAWYFATALAKQYDQVLPYLKEDRLDLWIHNKTIQKAVESYRVSPEQKVYLKSLRRKS